MNLRQVILVRHSFSTYNQQGRYQGCSDESILTAKGLDAAYQTGLALKDYQFDAIYSSPLQRVQQTTKEIIQALSSHQSPEIIFDDRLKEVNMLSWEGLSYEYVKTNYKEAYQCWQQTPHLFNFHLKDKTFFPVLELYNQARLFWEDILTKHDQKMILIVAHSGTNRALISTVMGLSPQQYHSLQQSNYGITYCQLQEQNNFDLVWFNSTIHLGEKLPKLKEGQQGIRYLFMREDSEHFQELLGYLKLAAIDFITDTDKPEKPFQNIVTRDDHVKRILEDEFCLPINKDYLYIIHCPTENKKILQGVLPISRITSEQVC